MSWYDSVDWGSLAGAAVDLFSSNQQAENTQQATQAASNAANEAKAAVSGIHQPTLDELTAQLQEYVSAGTYTPQQAVAILQEQSQLQGYTISPEVLSQQYQTLNQLSQIGQGGYTDAMRAGINRAQTEGNTAARGANLALQNEFNQRGLGGSGAEIVQRQMATQNASNQSNQQGLDIAEAAQAQALQALIAGGTQANNMRNQQTGEQDKIAAANDAIAKFNADVKQNTANANITNANAAQLANLSQKQQIADLNTQTANQTAINKANAQQQVYNNALNTAKSSAAASAPVVAAAAQQAKVDNAKIDAYTDAAQSAWNAYNKKSSSDGKTTINAARGGMILKDTSDEDIMKLLDTLVPRKRYM